MPAGLATDVGRTILMQSIVPFLARWEEEALVDTSGSTSVTEVKGETTDESDPASTRRREGMGLSGSTQITKAEGETSDYVDVLGRTHFTRTTPETTDESYQQPDYVETGAGGALAPLLARWAEVVPGSVRQGTRMTATRETTDDDRG